jgi:hypothetical protein
VRATNPFTDIPATSVFTAEDEAEMDGHITNNRQAVKNEVNNLIDTLKSPYAEPRIADIICTYLIPQSHPSQVINTE